MRESEVAAGADLSLFEVNAVDGQKVGVDVLLVVENPEDLTQPVRQCVEPCLLIGPVAQAAQPRRAFPFSPSCSPRASLTMMSTMLLSWSPVSPLDSSSAR